MHLGGDDGRRTAAFGRKVKGVRVFAEDAADYVETLLRRYRADGADGTELLGVRRAAGRRRARAVRGDAGGRPMSDVTPRAVPFYCPFCGEQELRPADPSGWRCESCERAFELSLTRRGR